MLPACACTARQGHTRSDVVSSRHLCLFALAETASLLQCALTVVVVAVVGGVPPPTDFVYPAAAGLVRSCQYVCCCVSCAQFQMHCAAAMDRS